MEASRNRCFGLTVYLVLHVILQLDRESHVSPVALPSNRGGGFRNRFLRQRDIFLRGLSGVDIEEEPVDRSGRVCPLHPQDSSRFHFAVFSERVRVEEAEMDFSFASTGLFEVEMDTPATASASGSGVKGKGVEAIADYELPWSVASLSRSILH